MHLTQFKKEIKSPKGVITGLYLLIQLAFFLIFCFFGRFVSSYAVRCLYISSIVLNAVMAIYLRRNEVFLLALFATIGADTCFSYLLPAEFNLGISFFLITQIIYAVYFYLVSQNKKAQLIILAIRIFLMILLPIICLFVFKDKANYLVYMASLYAANLLLNVISAFLIHNYPLAIGFILFTACDVFVMLTSPVIGVVVHFNWAWFFYTPSQVLLVLSEKTGSYFLN